MPNGELLLELLTEEIPARMQREGLEKLIERLTESLQNAYLEPDLPMQGYFTPRRLTVIVTGLPDKQSDFFEERRGPRANAPEAARTGFARSAGIAVEDLIEREGYYFAEITRVGRSAREVLPKAITEAIEETVWRKSMRFPAAPLPWVRPINSIICLFDGEIVPLSIGEIPVGNTTRGHRFLSEGEIAVESAADYLDKLASAYVVLDHDRRRDIIAADLDRLALAKGLIVKPDPRLLEEVAGLVEFPVVLMGAIDDASMELPPEILATAMRTHQKYFSCLNRDGTPAPRFLFVANNLTPDDGKTIVAGNERVLKARLADARFFWDQDRKVRLEDRLSSLDDRVFYAGLEQLRARAGSIRDKVFRVQKIAESLSLPVKADPPLVERAALLAKADLSTGMVGEFPELQGIMGRYYALHDGENPQVADAIAEHYKPLGPNDSCPTSPESVAVALADKIDTLVAFFAAGERPTGSRDPYALRRAALGVIRLVIENKLRLGLNDVLDEAELCLAAEPVADHLSGDVPRAALPPNLTQNVLEFIADRLKVHLRDEGIRHDLIAAVFALNEDNLVRLLARVDALRKFLETEDGADLLVAFRRASNIVAIEAKKGGWTMARVDPEAFRQPEETTLADQLEKVSARVGEELEKESFESAMSALATLRRPVDEFFDKVTVNDPDLALRENRLRLLSRIRAVMNQVADFSQIDG
jgi:glycyl-tRNA synthetase beta chain